MVKTAINALSELGYLVNMQQIYINCYTNNELFGQIDTKTGTMHEGLISNTLRSFNKNVQFNIINFVGEVI